jgi:hypothetical protein
LEVDLEILWKSVDGEQKVWLSSIQKEEIRDMRAWHYGRAGQWAGQASCCEATTLTCVSI